jgi:flagellar motor switch protein FliG
MFVFEDIAHLDERSLALILREIDQKDLAMALKVSTDDVKTRFFKCMSERASTMLKEDMEFLGAVRLRSVEEAQQKIVSHVRKLEEAGVIQVSRGGKEDEFVS